MKGGKMLCLKQERDLGDTVSTASSFMWRKQCWKNVIRSFIRLNIKHKYLSRAQPLLRQCKAINADNSHEYSLLKMPC